MGSVLNSGGGLDGVRINVQGAFSSLGALTAGHCTAVDQSLIKETVTNPLFQNSERDLQLMVQGTNYSARQSITIDPYFDGEFYPGNPTGLTPSSGYFIGGAVSQGDRNALQRGDLNNVSSLSEVITTYYHKLADGRYTTAQGEIFETFAGFSPSTTGLTDDASGRPLSVYTNMGGSSIKELNVTPR